MYASLDSFSQEIPNKFLAVVYSYYRCLCRVLNFLLLKKKQESLTKCIYKMYCHYINSHYPDFSPSLSF